MARIERELPKLTKSKIEMREYKGMKHQNMTLELGLTDEQINAMDKHLSRRVGSQLGVIDYYIGILCEEMDLARSGNHLPGAYKALPYDLKMKLLVSNEGILLER